jgi:hypothetical protein
MMCLRRTWGCVRMVWRNRVLFGVTVTRGSETQAPNYSSATRNIQRLESSGKVFNLRFDLMGSLRPLEYLRCGLSRIKNTA